MVNKRLMEIGISENNEQFRFSLLYRVNYSYSIINGKPSQLSCANIKPCVIWNVLYFFIFNSQLSTLLIIQLNLVNSRSKGPTKKTSNYPKFKLRKLGIRNPRGKERSSNYPRFRVGQVGMNKVRLYFACEEN